MVAVTAEYVGPLAAVGILVGLIYLALRSIMAPEPHKPDTAALEANTAELRLQRDQLAARLLALQESTAIEQDLGTFVYRAARLLSIWRDPEAPSPADAYRAWAEETSAYLTQKLGAAYTARFDHLEQQPGGAHVPPAFLTDPVRRAIWIRLATQAERLQAFIRERKTPPS